MTEETKKIFAAPWKIMPEDHGIVQDVNGAAVAICVSPAVANAVCRLPELYDALEQAANEFCEGCLVKHGYLDEEHSYYDLISNGCVLNAKGCKAFPWLKLLQKVRAGE